MLFGTNFFIVKITSYMFQLNFTFFHKKMTFFFCILLTMIRYADGTSVLTLNSLTLPLYVFKSSGHSVIVCLGQYSLQWNLSVCVC